MQDVDMSRVQSKPEGVREDDGPVWIINARALLFHHRHLQAGARRSKRCQVCRQGMAGLFTQVEAPSSGEEPGVVESGGSDTKGAAASASDSGIPQDLQQYQDTGWFYSASQRARDGVVEQRNRRR